MEMSGARAEISDAPNLAIEQRIRYRIWDFDESRMQRYRGDRHGDQWDKAGNKDVDKGKSIQYRRRDGYGCRMRNSLDDARREVEAKKSEDSKWHRSANERAGGESSFLRRVALTEILMRRQEIVLWAGRERFEAGRFQNRVFRVMGKSEPQACRSLIAITSMGRMADLDIQYWDFDHYIVDYLEVKEAHYNTYQEETIERLMTTKSEQGGRGSERSKISKIWQSGLINRNSKE